MRRSSAALGVAAMSVVALGGLWLAARPHGAVFGDSIPPGVATPAGRPWTKGELHDLADAIQLADREGLRPSDYRLNELQASFAAGRTGPVVDAVAGSAAAALAHDYASGRVRNRHRFNWYIDGAGPDAATLKAQLDAAREQGRLGAWLASLLPTSRDYQALRTALGDTPAQDGDRRDRIIANMERWRWLPRDFGGGDQLYVNLPTYRLEVVSGGNVTQTFKAVIGATDTPTPALSANVRQIIANPDWIVPASIVRRSHLVPGSSSRYIFSTRPDGSLRVRQKPGPGNALGRVKIEFPNPLAIYFHDTPSKSLFGADARAFSHGCVRVQDIEALALSIVARPDRFTAALADDRTRSFTPARPWRANIVYLTLVTGKEEGLTDLGDPYKMDAPLAAAVQGRKPPHPALPPATTPSPPHPRASRPPAAAPQPTIEPDAPQTSGDATDAAAPATTNQL